MNLILKTLVGSRAHGLANEGSDYDYRGVFILPTERILELGNVKTFKWGNDGDDTNWELGHFLFLATKSNPTILEVFLAPIVGMDSEEVGELYGVSVLSSWGKQLRSLFPYVWSSKGVRDAFIGYGLNQRKKFLDNKDNRRSKYAAAYLRVLYNAYELLNTGSFTIRIADTEVGEKVRAFKNGDFTIGEVVDICSKWQVKVDEAYKNNKEHYPDVERINQFLLDARRAFWHKSEENAS